MIRKLDRSLENNPIKLGCLTLILSVFLIFEVNPYLVNFPIIYFLSPVIFLVLGYEISYKKKLGFGNFFYLMYFFSVLGINNQMDGPTPPSENPFISLEKYFNLGNWEYYDFGEYSYYEFFNPNINFLYQISTLLIFIIIFTISFFLFGLTSKYENMKESDKTKT